MKSVGTLVALQGTRLNREEWEREYLQEFPVIRPKPDHDMYRGIPKTEPGYGNMLCPYCNALTSWEFLPDDMLRCTGCGIAVSREEATGK